MDMSLREHLLRKCNEQKHITFVVFRPVVNMHETASVLRGWI